MKREKFLYSGTIARGEECYRRKTEAVSAKQARNNLRHRAYTEFGWKLSDDSVGVSLSESPQRIERRPTTASQEVQHELYHR